MRTILLSVLFVLSVAGCTFEKAEAPFPSEGLEISKVISAFRVNFDMLEEKGKLYMAYYDDRHQMTLATYDVSSGKQDYQILPSKIGWDTHNYVTMAFDKDGYLHLSGNMHSSKLVYFRSSKPYDIHSMQPVHKMTGIEESRTTYPAFMESPEGELIFHYRTGGSGNGAEIYNVYDCTTKTWRRLIDQPLIDGKGEMNAYMYGPVIGNDGYYHLIWVWRDTADCSTNHTLSYARSKDLLHWETISGERTDLPITFDKTNFYVDPTPAKGGLFNPAIKLGFDSSNNPIIGYFKYDEDGNNQIFVARYDNGVWHKSQLTHWDYRWQFEGYGSMKNEIMVFSPVVYRPGEMTIRYEHIKEGSGEIIFDSHTLQKIGEKDVTRYYPEEYDKVTSSFPGMRVSVLCVGDYLLRWEHLPPNRDNKPQGALPDASRLMLYKVK